MRPRWETTGPSDVPHHDDQSPLGQLNEVVTDLEAVSGVADILDSHKWTLTLGMNVATEHLVVTDDASPQNVLITTQAVLAERHQIEHATLQVEGAPPSTATR